jgi:hypothetical protein
MERWQRAKHSNSVVIEGRAPLYQYIAITMKTYTSPPSARSFLNDPLDRVTALDYPNGVTDPSKARIGVIGFAM